jgi:hypothetical protein
MIFRNFVGLSGVFEKARRRHDEQRSVIAGGEMAVDARDVRIRGDMVSRVKKRAGRRSVDARQQKTIAWAGSDHKSGLRRSRKEWKGMASGGHWCLVVRCVERMFRFKASRSNAERNHHFGGSST